MKVHIYNDICLFSIVIKFWDYKNTSILKTGVVTGSKKDLVGTPKCQK